jgi:hypothetical protein
MDGAMPETLWQGFASGIGHPVIGLDHLAFLLAAGVLAAALPRGEALRAIAGFLMAGMAGLALHMAGIGLGPIEALIAASVLLAGLALLVAKRVSALALLGLKFGVLLLERLNELCHVGLIVGAGKNVHENQGLKTSLITPIVAFGHSQRRGQD